MPKATENAAVIAENERSKPLTLRKRIGSKDYIVSVHFSETSKETLNDKILRLIRNEAQK